MNDTQDDGARRRLLGTMASGAALALAGCASAATSRGVRARGTMEEDEQISPAEDLMREHGVLGRVLLVYEEYARRLDAGAAPPPEVLTQAAGLVRRFIEDYHERLEEQHLFPRFEAAGRETALVATLRVQHDRGRALTDEILALAPKPAERAPLTQALRTFSRMYRPHALREDTVLFPALRGLIGGAAYRELGERFEAREHELFGADGFGDAVRTASRLEQVLGIEDLAGVTPG